MPLTREPALSSEYENYSADLKKAKKCLLLQFWLDLIFLKVD